MSSMFVRTVDGKKCRTWQRTWNFTANFMNELPIKSGILFRFHKRRAVLNYNDVRQ